jgi:hypothetical protein
MTFCASFGLRIAQLALLIKTFQIEFQPDLDLARQVLLNLVLTKTIEHLEERIPNQRAFFKSKHNAEI